MCKEDAHLALAVRSGGGMVYRFEDLRVWQAAKRQADRVGELLKRPEFERDYRLKDQMSGASLSVMNNISEGFLRHHDPEFLQFLRFAAGSNGELRSCYHAASGRHYIGQPEADDLIAETNSIGKMIHRLQDSLRTGPKRQTNQRPPSDRPDR